MAIKVTSNTEPQANLDAVNGVVGKGEEKDKKSASAKADEINEESETSEESEDLENESEESEENEESEEQEKPKKPLKGFKRTIVKKDKEIAFLKAELAKKNEAKQAVREDSPDASKKADADKEPNIDDFTTYAEYNRALIKFEARQLIKEEKAEEAKKVAAENLENESKKAQDKFAKQYTEFAKTVDDLEETMDSMADITLVPVLQAAVSDSEIGPEILYHLAKNREELERINALSPVAIAREIGKIEAKLEKSASPKKEVVEKKQTKAPAPISSVKGSSGGSASLSTKDPGLSQKEYERRRNAQIAKKMA